MTIKRRDAQVGNYMAWSHNSNGYLRSCNNCGRTIYMKKGNYRGWLPYKSWINGDVPEGVWERHWCYWK